MYKMMISRISRRIGNERGSKHLDHPVRGETKLLRQDFYGTGNGSGDHDRWETRTFSTSIRGRTVVPSAAISETDEEAIFSIRMSLHGDEIRDETKSKSRSPADEYFVPEFGQALCTTLVGLSSSDDAGLHIYIGPFLFVPFCCFNLLLSQSCELCRDSR